MEQVSKHADMYVHEEAAYLLALGLTILTIEGLDNVPNVVQFVGKEIELFAEKTIRDDVLGLRSKGAGPMWMLRPGPALTARAHGPLRVWVRMVAMRLGRVGVRVRLRAMAVRLVMAWLLMTWLVMTRLWVMTRLVTMVVGLRTMVTRPGTVMTVRSWTMIAVRSVAMTVAIDMDGLVGENLFNVDKSARLPLRVAIEVDEIEHLRVGLLLTGPAVATRVYVLRTRASVWLRLRLGLRAYTRLDGSIIGSFVTLGLYLRQARDGKEGGRGDGEELHHEVTMDRSLVAKTSVDAKRIRIQIK